MSIEECSEEAGSLLRENLYRSVSSSSSASSSTSSPTSTASSLPSNSVPTTSTTTSKQGEATDLVEVGPQSQSEEKLSTGAKAGIGVGAALGAVIVGVVGFYAWWLRRRNRQDGEMAINSTGAPELVETSNPAKGYYAPVPPQSPNPPTTHLAAPQQHVYQHIAPENMPTYEMPPNHQSR